MSKRNRPVLAIGVTGQTPLVEFRQFGESRPKWIVWLAYDLNRDAGTYLILNDDGSVIRETTYPDGSVEAVVVMPVSDKRAKHNHIRESGS